ncbi:MAG: hypothetical protein COB14_02635 [Alphaproteobacteria bacterium]|nr:MAG: hypothetical protein COB14_02635 [Alphaproteobacteria bacterium]
MHDANEYEEKEFAQIIIRFVISVAVAPFIGVYILFFSMSLDIFPRNISLAFLFSGFAMLLAYPFMFLVGIPTIIITELISKKKTRKIYIFLIYISMGFLSPIAYGLYSTQKPLSTTNVLSIIEGAGFFGLFGLSVACISYFFMHAYRKY